MGNNIETDWKELERINKYFATLKESKKTDKNKAKINENALYNIIKKQVKKALTENFEHDYKAAQENFSGRMFGFELMNEDGDWEYDDIHFDPNSMKMSCLGVSIDVDPDISVDSNLEMLYEKLLENGYSSGD